MTLVDASCNHTGVPGVKPVIIELTDFKTKEKVDELEVDACMVATGRAPFTQVRRPVFCMFICPALSTSDAHRQVHTTAVPASTEQFRPFGANTLRSMSLWLQPGSTSPAESNGVALQGLNLAAVGASTIRGGFIPVNEKMQVAKRVCLAPTL